MDMREQKFGIEIELTGLTRQKAAEVISKYLGNSYQYDGGYYEEYSMQVAANHAVPSGAMPFQEVLRVYGEDQITGVGSCIDYEKRKIKRIGKLRIRSVHHCYIVKDGYRKELLYV